MDELSETQRAEILSKLCVELGICLPALAHARFVKTPPKDIERFVSAVLTAEGLSGDTKSPLFKPALEIVRRYARP